MPDFHTKKITLPSGKTVELVYLAADGPDAPPVEAPVDEQTLRVRRIELCPDCDSDRVHPVDWHEVDERHWRLDVRCPDCRWMGSDVFGQDEVEQQRGPMVGRPRGIAPEVQEQQVFGCREKRNKWLVLQV